MNSPNGPTWIVSILALTCLASVLTGCGGEEAELCRAVREGKTDRVEELLNRNVSVNARDKLWADFTPLHWAARIGDEETASLLLEKGANIEARDFNGKTPLHWAAAEGKLDTVRLLVVSGANVNALDDGGGSPVWAAGFANRKDVEEFLIENDAVLPPPESRKNKVSWSAWNWQNAPMFDETAAREQSAQSGGRTRIPGPLVVLFVISLTVGFLCGVRAALRPYFRRRY